MYGGYRPRGRHGRYRFRSARSISWKALALLSLAVVCALSLVWGISSLIRIGRVLLSDYVIYDEEIMREYAEEQYYAEFAGGSVEDNVLIVVLVEPEYKKYYSYVRVGSHIAPEFAELYVGESSTFSRSIQYNIEPGYENTLSMDLVRVFSRMNSAIWDTSNVGDLYICQEGQVRNSRLVNYSDMKLQIGSISQMLGKSYFPTVLLIEEMEEVFGNHIPLREILTAVVALVAGTGLVALAVLYFRSLTVDKKPSKNARTEGTDYVDRLDDEHWEEQY